MQPWAAGWLVGWCRVSRLINGAGLEIIQTSEGLRLESYLDTGGVPTIGWGHTGKEVKLGQHISLTQAIALLAADVGWAEDVVHGLTHDVLTNDNQFSAMVSLTFNIGQGQFKTSTCLRRHRAGNYIGAAEALQWFVYDNGVKLSGLVKRRKREAALYLEPILTAPPEKVDTETLPVREQVMDLQRSLKALGLYPGIIDGDPGPLTIGALRAWRASA